MNAAITWKSSQASIFPKQHLFDILQKFLLGAFEQAQDTLQSCEESLNAVREKMSQAKWITACLISQRQFHYANPTQDLCGENLQNIGIAACFNCFDSSLCEKLIKQNLE